MNTEYTEIEADALPIRQEEAHPSQNPCNPGESAQPKEFEWISNREAIRILGLSKASLQRYRSSGLLRHSRLGGNIYYRRSDIEAVLERSLRSSTSREVSQ